LKAHALVAAVGTDSDLAQLLNDSRSQQ